MKIEFKQLKSFLGKLPRILAEKAILTFFGLIILSLIFGALVFYKYSILAEKTETPLDKEPLEFKEDLFQKFLKEQQERAKRFQEIESKDYPDPFRQKLTE